MFEEQLVAVLKGISENLVALKNGQTQKAISGVPDVQLMFGSGGLFSNFGLDTTVVNASLSPHGMDRVIPVIGTTELNPIYPFITGFEMDDNFSEPAGPCDDAPSGVMEVCHQVATFGRYTRGSKEMEINELMQILNKHLTTDLRVLGSMLGEGHMLLPQQAASADSATFVQSVVKTQLMIIAVELQRKLCQQLWVGDPANNNVGGGYREFPGLDMLVATGKVDAISGVACAALDPDVKDFGYNPITGQTPDIVAYLTMMDYYINDVSRRTGLTPVEWVIAMRPQLFFELCQVWPCRYLTYRCANDVGTNVGVINDDTNVRMRDDMWNGSYLIINGRKVPVVTDDGIFEHNSTNNGNLQPGQFASDIYILPIRAKSMPVLYWEHLDYTRAFTDLSVLQGNQRFWTSDGGRYMWAMQDLNYCFKFQGKIEPRVVLRTPHLCGRLQHVMYEPLQHLRDPFEDSPYFKKGGSEGYRDPTYYSEWNPPQ